jgi:hypothetical protein
MDWLDPWYAITDGSNDRLVQELHRELCSDHILFGVSVRPIGRREDCDDVLFELTDGSNRVALVHLTYAQHPETNPLWPSTQLFTNLELFAGEEMVPAHENRED